MIDWMIFWIVPLYGAGGSKSQAEGMPEKVYAPDLDTAFSLSRTRWPSASGWRLLRTER